MSYAEFTYDENVGFIGTGDTPDWKIGEDREQVRKKFGSFRTFRRTPDARETDDFVNFATQVVYTDTGRVGFIEVSRPTRVKVRGIQVLGVEGSVVFQKLRDKGVDIETDDAGATAPELGLGFFVGGDVEIDAVSCGNPDIA